MFGKFCYLVIIKFGFAFNFVPIEKIFDAIDGVIQYNYNV